MSEATPSVSRSLVWILLTLLIAVVALYKWHQGNLNQDLAEKDSAIAQTSQQLTAANAKLRESAAIEQGLRGEVDALNSKYMEQTQDLTGKLDAAGLAYAELEGKYESDEQKIATLSAELAQLEQSMTTAAATYETRMAEAAAAHETQVAEAAAAQQAQMAEATAAHEAQIAEATATHQAQAQELEQQLNERIEFYRTALEGNDPDRAAQMANLDEQIQANQQALDSARQTTQALETEKTELTENLANATRIIGERDQVLAEAGQRLESLQGELTQSQSTLAELQARHDAAVAQATEELAAIQGRLQSAEASHAQAQADAADRLEQTMTAAAATLDQTKAEATAALEQAEIEAADALEQARQVHAGQLAEAEGRVSSLTKSLQAETVALAALQQKHASMVADLRGNLEDTEKTLARVESELNQASNAAMEAKQAYEQQIGTAKSEIAEIEMTLEDARQEAVEYRQTSQREHVQDMVDVRDLYAKFSALSGRHTDKGMLLNLANTELRFSTSKATLPEGDLPSLDRIAALLVEYPKLTARIEGHTDSSGREETNLELSQERADAIMQGLIGRGVVAERMVAEGIGEAMPIADNKRAAGRGQNRRVEIYIIEQ